MPKANRDIELRVRVNAAERKAMQAAADARGQTLSAWLRLVAQDAAGRDAARRRALEVSQSPGVKG